MDLKNTESKLNEIVARAKQELGTIRANRPTPMLVEGIKVEYFGQLMPVNQLGAISVVPPRDLVISVWDNNALAPTAKAIESSNSGLSVAVQGNIIRVTLPQLNDDRRKELGKMVKGMIEAERIKVRIARDEEMKKIDTAERAKEITENEKFNLRKKTQELVDKTNKELDSALDGKMREIES